MTQCFAFSCGADRASLGGIAVSSYPSVTQSFALGCGADGASLGSDTVGIDPVMTQCFTFGSGANRTSLGGIAISFHPSVAQCKALASITDTTDFGLGTGCAYPNMTQSRALGGRADGTGLGCVAVGCYPAMAQFRYIPIYKTISAMASMGSITLFCTSRCNCCRNMTMTDCFLHNLLAAFTNNCIFTRRLYIIGRNIYRRVYFSLRARTDFEITGIVTLGSTTVL